MEAERRASLDKFLIIDPAQLLVKIQFLTEAWKVQLFKDKQSQVHNIKSLFS